jgi:hypothetical protein
MYTFWDNMRNRWERDGGLRPDHILLSSALVERPQDAGVDRQTRGVEGAVEGTGVQHRSRRSHRRVNSAAWSFTKSAMLVGVSPVSLR